jgi:hypothetical protein
MKPCKKTHKYNRERSKLLPHRIINEIMTSTIKFPLATNNTQTTIPEKHHESTQFPSLRKKQTNTSPSQYLFHNQSKFMDGEKDIPVTKWP